MGVFSRAWHFISSRRVSISSKKRFELLNFNSPSPSYPLRQFPCLPLISGSLGSGHNYPHTQYIFLSVAPWVGSWQKVLFLTKQPESKRVSFKNFVSCFSLDCLRVQHPMFPRLMWDFSCNLYVFPR